MVATPLLNGNDKYALHFGDLIVIFITVICLNNPRIILSLRTLVPFE